jgi:pimeloyl-ACP methyl ester carboxylesterase
MPRPTIVFSHANGFPAGTYRALFRIWRRAGYRVRALAQFGHDERFPVTSNWPHLREELIEFIDHEAGAPVWLVGHSMGGYLSVLAASRRPDLALGVVLLDAPILGDLLAQTLRLAKVSGLIERYSPGHVARRRRQRWASAEEAFAHFASKRAFARWAPGVLRDYIDCGVVPAVEAGGGCRLAFAREVEAAIYDAVPHHMPALLRRHPLRCPLAFIGGTRSVENRQVGLAATERLAQGRMSFVEGSHLFPFEQPQAAAAQVLHWLRAFTATPGA